MPTLKRRSLWWLLASLLVLAVPLTLVVMAASSAPAIPQIALSGVPLFAATSGDKPVMALALSVEYPTVGAQYTAGGNSDATYTNTAEYLGYYDAESCYTYNDTPTESPASGLTAADYKRFDRSGPASSRMCANAFSGNYLNWASSSAIDMLRLALSGGDRTIDTPALTILQRAVIPDGDPICMWNSSNFPAKQLQKNGGGSCKYWGAVPTSLITQAAGSDIWVANTLERIYFGTSSTGGCGDTAAYILGAAGAKVGPISSSNKKLPNDASAACASEEETCNFTGIREVWFGDARKWAVAPASGGVKCSNSVFGDPAPGTTKYCYTRPYSGNWKPAAGDLNSDGFFYARVQVCKGAAGALQDVRDYGLCKPYPNGNYKPTGSIQKYSDQLRLAAFGYLMDQTSSASAGGRYGGVLRAPMKFVGAKTFDVSGTDNTVTGGNPNAEWNANTGVFYTNPDGDTTQRPAISGVINYLNQFGRTGPVAGRYKIYDPVGELHYEVLRYLQGLQPSTAAVAGVTAAMYDGFPAAMSWTDPYGGARTNTADYSCLKSNIVTIGDVNSHDGNRLPSASVSGNVPDLHYWRSIVQSFERNSATSYTDGQGTSRTTGNPNTANGSVPTSSGASQVMGSAYWSHTHDIRGQGWSGDSAKIRPGLRVRNFFFDVNEYGASNVDSYRRNSNQFFLAAKYGGFENDASDYGGRPYNTWGNPFRKQDGTIDNNVWQDNSNAGEARSFYLQSSARSVLSAFDNIFGLATTAARSIAGSATSARNITQAGSSIYQASFDTSDWSGDVLSLPLTISTGNVVSVGVTPLWTAATRLAAMTAPAQTRNIVVGRTGATSIPTATKFTWAEIDASLKGLLAKTSPTAISDTFAQDRLNYLRGDRSLEGSTFRSRNKLLGDIVNSGVVYEGAPSSSLTAESGYAAFYTANLARAPTVYVGANDGMLHAFNATTGNEVFAYVPSWMGARLGALTSPDYNSNHQNYVDATAVVAEGRVGNAGAASDWKTVLVSGTGGGGRGVFALDVTNPAAFTAASAMWEFTQADDPDMGFVTGTPKIVKMRTSAPGSTAVYRWFAVVASGVNNYVPGSDGIYSLTGQPALFLLALDKPKGAAWASGGSSPNYYKLSFPVDAAVSAVKAAGLVNFAASFGAAREVAQIFAGDLHGNLWKLDFTKRASTEWSVNNLSAYNKGSLGYPLALPMYVARTAANAVQAITMAPSLVAGPVVNGRESTYVAFGTGKYLEAADKTSAARDSFYVVYDNGLPDADSSPPGAGAISGRGRLIAGTASASTGIVAVAPFTWGRATSNSDATQRSGWFIDFSTAGERQVSNALVFGDSLIFGSLIPGSAGAEGSCTAAGGGGREYLVNVDTGNGTSTNSRVGLLGEPFVDTLVDATTYTISASTGRRVGTRVTQVVQQGSNGLSTSQQLTSTFVAGRLSWRQISNYQDLRNAP